MSNSIVVDRLRNLRQEQQRLEQELIVETHQEAMQHIQGLDPQQQPEGLIQSRPGSAAAVTGGAGGGGGGPRLSSFGVNKDPNAKTESSSGGNKKQKTSAPIPGEKEQPQPLGSRKAILGRYFDAMSENPDYNERRERRMSSMQPFSFDLRENRRAKSTSRRRFEEENERRESEIQMMTNNQFKANPVPPSTYLHKYEMMVQEWCARKQDCQAQAQQRARQIKDEALPAKQYAESFSKRKEDTFAGRRAISAQRERDARFNKKFVAKDVPLDVKMPMWEEMQCKDADRHDRIRLRADNLLSISSRPPRMEAAEELRLEKEMMAEAEEACRQHSYTAKAAAAAATGGAGANAAAIVPVTEQQKRQVAQRRQLAKQNPNFTFKPMVVTTVPDYEYIWAKDRVDSMRRKESKATTVPREFGLHHSSKDTRKKLETQMKRDEQEGLETRWPYKSSRGKIKPTPAPKKNDCVAPPRGTTAQELKAESAFKAILSQSESKNKEAQARQDRLKKQKEANKRMAPFFAMQKEQEEARGPSLADMVKEKKAAMKRNDAAAQLRLKELEDKVRADPPVFMEPSHLDEVAKARAATEEQVLSMLREKGLGVATLTAIMTSADVSAVDVEPTPATTTGSPAPTAGGATSVTAAVANTTSNKVDEPSLVEDTNKVNQVNNAVAVPVATGVKPAAESSAVHRRTVSSSSSDSSSSSSSSSGTFSSSYSA